MLSVALYVGDVMAPALVWCTGHLIYLQYAFLKVPEELDLELPSCAS